MNITPRRRLVALAAVGAALAATVAAAADEDAPANRAFPEGWYVAPMATYLSPDAERCNVDSDYGAMAAFGHRGAVASIEAWAQFLSLPHGPCTYLVPGPATPDPSDDERVSRTDPAGDVELNGGGLALLVGPFSERQILSRIYGLVGIGVLQRKGHPHYRDDHSSIVGDVGAGYLQPFRLWEREFLVRLEARYRYDVQPPPEPEDGDPPPTHTYNDVIVNLGLQVPLSKPREPVAADEPVSVVAVSDSDADGVADDADTCPGTGAGVPVDASGCAAAMAPAAEPTLETARAGDTIVLKGVNFETGRATLTANARTLLDGVAQQLQQRAELHVEIGGHTDARGNEGYNQALSEQRAQAVRDYLAGQGVDAARLSAVGYGEAQPVDSNETDEGRERNRRVELKVLEQSPQSPTSTPGEAS